MWAGLDGVGQQGEQKWSEATIWRHPTEMGVGEAASLPLGCHCGWIVASDERTASLREARSLGPLRILGAPPLASFPGLFLIEAGDADKLDFESRRLSMSFASFRDVL